MTKIEHDTEHFTKSALTRSNDDSKDLDNEERNEQRHESSKKRRNSQKKKRKGVDPKEEKEKDAEEEEECSTVILPLTMANLGSYIDPEMLIDPSEEVARRNNDDEDEDSMANDNRSQNSLAKNNLKGVGGGGGARNRIMSALESGSESTVQLSDLARSEGDEERQGDNESNDGISTHLKRSIQQSNYINRIGREESRTNTPNNTALMALNGLGGANPSSNSLTALDGAAAETGVGGSAKNSTGGQQVPPLAFSNIPFAGTNSGGGNISADSGRGPSPHTGEGVPSSARSTSGAPPGVLPPTSNLTYRASDVRSNTKSKPSQHKNKVVKWTTELRDIVEEYRRVKVIISKLNKRKEKIMILAAAMHPQLLGKKNGHNRIDEKK